MPTNYTPSQVYDKYVALQKQLATSITNKGVTASQTELYDNLIDKVAQIENLKGEERTLENFTNVLSEPKSVVQLEYPIDNMITVPYTGSQAGSSITAVVNSDNSVTFNGTAATGVSTYYNFKSFPTLDAGTYAYSMQDVPGCHYTLGAVKAFDEGTTSGTISVPSDKTSSYFVLNIPAGTTLNNVTVRQPVLYKVPESKTLNAKLGSKNLIPYPFTYESTTSNGVTFTDNKNGTITLNGQLSDNTTPATYVLFTSSNVDKLGLKPNTDYYLSCSDSNLTISLRTVKTDGTNKFYSYGNIKFPSEETPDRLFLQVKKDDTRTFENTVISIQLEFGNKATEYVPYSREVIWESN